MALTNNLIVFSNASSHRPITEHIVSALSGLIHELLESMTNYKDIQYSLQ